MKKILKRIGTFMLMLLTAGRSSYKISEAFEYLKSPEYHNVKQSAYRERRQSKSRRR
jgi:hypothetical protein